MLATTATDVTTEKSVPLKQSKMNSLTLTVSHNIFLDRTQRYDLFDNKEIEVIGVSVPVWLHKGKTSEPGHEVFCKYKLIPTKFTLLVKHNSVGYDIYLPHETHNTKDDKINPLTLKNILDVQDGGVSWLAFRQVGKAKKNKTNISIINFVEIKNTDELEKTL